MTIFRKIIDGELPASVVHRDDRVIAFMDIRPITPGHLLVCPLASVDTLDKLDPPARAHLWEMATRLGAAQQQALGSVAQHLVVNDGRGANQSVPHVHVHVIPRYHRDGLQAVGRLLAHFGQQALRAPVSARRRARLDEQARRIAVALRNHPEGRTDS